MAAGKELPTFISSVLRKRNKKHLTKSLAKYKEISKVPVEDDMEGNPREPENDAESLANIDALEKIFHEMG